MKKIILIIGFILFSLPSIVKGDDNFYLKNSNELISNNYKIILENNITSDILIDNLNLFFYSNSNFYIVNKTSGNIDYKLKINNLQNLKQTDNFIYLDDGLNIYKINKSSGIIEEKRIFYKIIDSIYTFFGVSSSSGITNIFNNYTNNTYVNGSQVDNSTIQINESQVNNLNTDLNNKWNKTDNLNNSILINENQVNSLNINLNSKVNKSGDTMSGDLSMSTNKIINVSTISLLNNIQTLSWSGYGIDYWIGMANHNNNGVSALFLANGEPTTNNYAFQFGTTNNTVSQPNLVIVGKKDTKKHYISGGNDGSAPNGGWALVLKTGNENWNSVPDSVIIMPDAPANSLNVTGTGEIKMSNLTGSGNAYVCVDANGKQYRGNPNC